MREELNISPETRNRRHSFAQHNKHLHVLSSKKTNVVEMFSILADSSTLEELNLLETFGPQKSATPTVG